jgi:hypothetical protein
MNRGDETLVKIKVSGIWSESVKCWHFLIKEGITPGAWSTGVWFPKKSCIYDEKAGTLEVPLWLFNAKELNGIATILNSLKTSKNEN